MSSASPPKPSRPSKHADPRIRSLLHRCRRRPRRSSSIVVDAVSPRPPPSTPQGRDDLLNHGVGHLLFCSVTILDGTALALYPALGSSDPTCAQPVAGSPATGLLCRRATLVAGFYRPVVDLPSCLPCLPCLCPSEKFILSPYLRGDRGCHHQDRGSDEEGFFMNQISRKELSISAVD